MVFLRVQDRTSLTRKRFTLFSDSPYGSQIDNELILPIQPHKLVDWFLEVRRYSTGPALDLIASQVKILTNMPCVKRDKLACRLAV